MGHIPVPKRVTQESEEPCFAIGPLVPMPTFACATQPVRKPNDLWEQFQLAWRT